MTIDQALTSFYLFVNLQPDTWLGLFALLSLADAITTIIGLRRGGREANPIMAWVMARIGAAPTLLAIKLPGFLAIWASLGYIILYLPVVVIFYACVVVWNVWVLRAGSD